jgi:hypothetical protein
MQMVGQPQVTGIESLQGFQDNMNSKSGLERLRAMQTLGLMSLANDTYMSEQQQPTPPTGIQSLPQVQAGFGGFLKNVFKAVTRIPKAIAKGVSGFAKSSLGKMIVPAALAFAAPWAMGLSFSSSPFLYSAMAGLGSGVGSLVTGAKPGQALKSALMGGLATYAGGHLFSKLGGAGATTGKLASEGTSNLVRTGLGSVPTTAGGSASLGSLGQFGAPASQSFGAFGTGPAAQAIAQQTAQAASTANPLLSAMGGSQLTQEGARQFAIQEAITKAGIPSSTISQAGQPAFSGIQFTGGGSAVAPLASVQPGAQSIFSGDTSMEALKNLPRQAFNRLTKTPEGWGTIARDMVPSADETTIKELEDYGFTESPSSFGTQEAYYVNPDTGQDMSIPDAVAYMRGRSQGITGSQRLDQATQQGGYGYLAPQLKYRKYGGAVGTGGLIGLTDDGMQIFDNSQEGALNRATHGGILEGYNYTPSTGGTAIATGKLTTGDNHSTFPGGEQYNPPTGDQDSSYGVRLPKDAIEGTALYNLDPVQQRSGIYNAHDVRDSGMSLIRPADAPVTIIQEQTQTPHRDPYTGKIPYDLWHEPVVNDFGQGYDLKDMDYFTANALALKEGATRFKYNNEYARVDPGLLSNYDYSNLGTKPYSYVDNLAINQPDVAFNKIHSGIAADPNSQAAKRAQGLYPGLYGGWSDTPGAGNTPYPTKPTAHYVGGGYGVSPYKGGGQILHSSGGLMGYAYGGQLPEFSGQVPGDGHGMEDNISFPITERQGGGDVQIAEGRLSPDEYVVDANTMSLLGNGSSDAGAKIMDQTVKDIRMAATGQKEQQKEINGLQALSRMKRNI